MYKHVVLWKLKESAQGMSKQELAEEVKKRLDELPAHIPEIKPSSPINEHDRTEKYIKTKGL